MESSNVRKKKREPPNVIKKLSNVMLELHNVRMEASNVRKKVRELPNMRKELSYVILELHNMRIEASDMKKKKKSKGITKSEKKTITCNIGIA